MNSSTFTAFIAVLVVIAGCGLVVLDNHASDDGQPERIGIVGAMPCEVENILNEMTLNEKKTIADMEFNVGKLYGHDVVVVQCGMGKVNAGVCAQTLISQFNVKAVINSGAAGSLDPALSLGDFVISEKTAQHDYDVSPIGDGTRNYEKGEIPYTGKVYFDADSDLRESAVKAIRQSAPDKDVVTGLICTGDLFVVTGEQKSTILANYPDGKCCEMEGGAIAQICYLNHIPFVIIRAISDNGDGEEFADHMEEIGHQTANAVISMIRGM